MTSLNKTLSVLLTALAAIGASQVASASPTLTLYQGPYSSGDGGEFIWNSATLNPGGYASSTMTTIGGTPAFDTFCVQAGSDDVFFTPGNTYNYAISGQIKGGTGSPADPRALNVDVAWLYAQFATGHLSDYDYSNAGGLRSTDAGALQNEIWFLEGEGGSANAFYTSLLGTAGITSGDTAATFGVQVLNLSYVDPTTGDTIAAQNQLVYSKRGFGNNGHPIPDNGLTIALIGISCLGLAAFRRKSVKA